MNIKSLLGVSICITLIAVITVHASNPTIQTSPKMNEMTDQTEYPTNEQGETYGDGAFPAGKKGPDLIRAEGEDGVVGYVKSTDLEPSMSSPEEAIAYSKLMEKLGHQSIPLYKEDGKTIIGEFVIYSPQR